MHASTHCYFTILVTPFDSGTGPDRGKPTFLFFFTQQFAATK
jgi:hypothetical protein